MELNPYCLSDLEATDKIDRLRQQYRDLVLNYFQANPDRAVEEFVTELFNANLSVSDLIIIHTELIEDLTRQLHIEGRNPNILLDYRITLIDVIAHLCERYRSCLSNSAQALGEN